MARRLYLMISEVCCVRCLCVVLGVCLSCFVLYRGVHVATEEHTVERQNHELVGLWISSMIVVLICLVLCCCCIVLIFVCVLPQITGMGNRTVIVDNNTRNNTHIATVGLCMASSEERAYPVMRMLDVCCVVVSIVDRVLGRLCVGCVWWSYWLQQRRHQ